MSFLEWVIQITDRTLRETRTHMVNANPIPPESAIPNGEKPIVRTDQKCHIVLLVEDEHLP